MLPAAVDLFMGAENENLMTGLTAKLYNVVLVDRLSLMVALIRLNGLVPGAGLEVFSFLQERRIIVVRARRNTFFTS